MEQDKRTPSPETTSRSGDNNNKNAPHFGGKHRRHQRHRSNGKRLQKGAPTSAEPSATVASVAESAVSTSSRPVALDRQRSQNGKPNSGKPSLTAEEVHLNQEITPNLVSDQFIETPGIEGYIPDTSRIPDFMADTPKDTAPIEKTEVVSVCFKPGGKSYFFDPRGTRFRVGSHVIVDTARGAEFGEVTAGNTSVPSKDVVQPLRAIIRPATREDAIKNDENRVLEKEALKICEEKIREHGLEMELVEAQYTFDRAKLLFYFTSDSRVDFRELVKDLAFKFHTRIELRQIGIRDEAKMIGGIGVCGRPLCCASFLSNFVQVSIKMAKEQNLSLNSGKISGTCGRLMCCLHYEYDTYREEAALTPPVGSVVQTADGNGTVVETNPLAQCVKVRLFDKQDQAPVVYHRDKVTVIAKKGSADAKNIASAANTEKN